MALASTETSVRSRGRQFFVFSAIGFIAGLLSIGRLRLFDTRAPSEVLWAEDGLFPLCIRKADFVTCLVEPFAGYFLFLPRVLAWPISWLDWELWALASNITAAVIAAVIAALSAMVLRQFGLHWFVVVFGALLPVLAPITGLEAINAIGSSYMLLLFLSTLVVALPPRSGVSRPYVIFGFALLLVTALTIPSAAVLLIIVLVMGLRGVLPLRVVGTWMLALVAGLVVQAAIAVTAARPRPVTITIDSLNLWADSIPTSVFTFWPGLSLGEYSFFANFTLAPVSVTGWLMAAGLMFVGIWLILRHRGRLLAVGVMLIAGLGFGFIPSAIGYTNNRYFVVPLLLWGVALLVALDPVIARARVWVVALVSALILVLWWPAIAASAFRATPAPLWSAEVARVEAACRADPSFVDRPLFTPFWPPNWGDGLSEPTHPNLPCLVVWTWLDE